MAVTREVEEHYRAVAADKNIEFTCALPAEEAYVQAEGAALSAAVAALVDNAMKYTPEAGRVVVRAT